MGQTSLRSAKGGFWKLENNGIDERGSFDISTITATYTPDGKVGGCYDLDGSSNILITSLTQEYSYITIMAWIRLDGYGGGGGGRIVSKNLSGENFMLSVSSLNSGSFLFLRKYSSSNGNWRTTTSTAPTNQWLHIAVIYEEGIANNPSFYVDGVLKTSNETLTPSGTIVTNNQPWGIGNIPNNAIRGFDGKIDEVKILNRAVSLTEVKMDYNNGDGILYVQENFRNNGDFNKLISYVIDGMYLSWIL